MSFDELLQMAMCVSLFRPAVDVCFILLSCEVCSFRYKEAGKRIAAAEEQEHFLQQEVAELQGRLEAGSRKAAAHASTLEEQAHQQAQDLVAAAVQEAEAEAQEAAAKLEAELQARTAELEVCAIDCFLLWIIEEMLMMK